MACDKKTTDYMAGLHGESKSLRAMLCICAVYAVVHEVSVRLLAGCL